MLIKDAIEYLKQQTDPSVLATPEEQAYFSPKKEMSTFKMDPMTDIRQLVTKVLPDVPLAMAIPDDAQAKKRADYWKENHLAAKVIVVSFGETGPALQFLHNVTKAIDSLLAPAHLIDGSKIEKEKGWEMVLNSPTLQLVIAPPLMNWKMASIARLYRENPSSNTHFLQNTPLIFFHPVSSYLKNPDLKRELWKNLTSLLSTST